MNKNLISIILLSVLSSHAVAADYEKPEDHANAVSNYLLGIQPDAKGDKFKLLKTNKYDPTAATAAGAVGTAVLGNAPLSVGGASTAVNISLGLNLLGHLLFKKDNEPLYKSDRTKNSYFGKYYLTGNYGSDKEAKADFIKMMDISVKENAQKILKLDAKLKNTSSTSLVYCLTADKESTECLYYAFVGFTYFVKSKPDQLRDSLYAFSPTYETTDDYGFRIAVNLPGERGFNYETLNQPEWIKFTAAMTSDGHSVLMSPNLVGTFYKGEVYYNVQQDTSRPAEN